jgi:ATP-binding cassette subfamily B protein
MQSFQDARISLERINEIHNTVDEEPANITLQSQLPKNKSIVINNLSYKYPGYETDWVLNNININIPHGKTTAIVGVSGSGKTTLLKLLLRFYDPGKGEIRIDNVPLNNISHRYWRSRCGTVMQEGYIFSDSIANNITLKDEYPDLQRLTHALEVANIHDFIASLPLGYNTKIGTEGNGISQGQRQRILIARAVYKDPDYIFFDEATNSLDANNEKVIMRNMENFFKGKTVVIVAHRLSTVKHADQIIVLNKGKITEWGRHEELIFKQGDYYELVRNQLELAVN